MTQHHPADDGLAAVAAAVVDAESTHRRLLQSVVSAAVGIFGARASSIFLLDEPADQLVFAAVAGEGERHLVGRRFPAREGIAGWVLASREPMVVTDLATNTTFSRAAAESTGYVPNRLLAAPLIRDERAIGVLEVLDHDPDVVRSRDAISLLMLIGDQASVAIEVVERNLASQRLLAGQDDDDYDDLVAITRSLAQLDGARRQAGAELLSSLRTLLDSSVN
jgi:GAF domain-containing protein